jgi:hypothetical protein
MAVRPAHQYLFVIMATALFSAASSASAAQCGSACLKATLKSYESKVLRHRPTGLALTKDVRMTQNYKPINAGDGYWRTISKFAFQTVVADPTAGQVAAVGFLRDADRDAYFALRLKVENRKISQSEMFLVHKGDATFFGADPDPKAGISPAYEQLVPPALRSRRETLVRIANAFDDSWQYRNEDLAPFADDCTFYENHVELTDPNGPSGGSCGGIVEYGGKNGVRGLGKAGRANAPRPPGQNPNAGGNPDGGPGGPPPSGWRDADPSIGLPQLYGSQMWMRDRRYPIVDIEHGVVLGYSIQGGSPARPGETVVYNRDTPFNAANPTAGGPGSGAAYMVSLYKIVGAKLVRIDHFEWEGGPNASSGFADLTH